MPWGRGAYGRWRMAYSWKREGYLVKREASWKNKDIRSTSDEGQVTGAAGGGARGAGETEGTTHVQVSWLGSTPGPWPEGLLPLRLEANAVVFRLGGFHELADRFKQRFDMPIMAHHPPL